MPLVLNNAVITEIPPAKSTKEKIQTKCFFFQLPNQKFMNQLIRLLQNDNILGMLKWQMILSCLHGLLVIFH